MGWSCNVAADDVLQAASDVCLKETGTANTWRYQGKEYFYEEDQEDQPDGGIAGVVMVSLPGDLCQQAGTFYITGDGRVIRAPKAFKALLKKAGVRL